MGTTTSIVKKNHPDLEPPDIVVLETDDGKALSYDQVSGRKGAGLDHLQSDEIRTSVTYVAVDIGSAQSGYAFSFHSNPKKVHYYKWTDCDIKAPSVLLMLEKGEPCLGNEAWRQYAALLDHESNRESHLVERLNLQVMTENNTASPRLEFKDINETPVEAIHVYTAALSFMRKHATRALSSLNIDIGTDQVHWIVTVPTIGKHHSKQVIKMIESASINAGISRTNLSLVLEMEATAEFCKHGSKSLEGQIIVVDVGGMAKMSVCSVKEDKTLSVTQEAVLKFGSGIDEEFLDLMSALFGKDIVRHFKATNVRHYFDLVSSFEVKKRVFCGSNQIIMPFPVELLNAFKEETGEDIDHRIKRTGRTGHITFKRNMSKLVLSLDIIKDMFDRVVKPLCAQIQELLDKDRRSAHHIVLVGGFAECPYVCSTLKSRFGKLVFCPNRPQTATLKGSLLNVIQA